MDGYYIEPATRDHIVALIEDVREDDVREWVEAGRRLGIREYPKDDGLWVYAELIRSVELGDSFALTDGRKVLCIWGVGRHPKHAGTGVAWLIGTNEGQRLANRVQRLFKQGVEDLHRLYPTLEAHVWAANPVHLYWLYRMGFKDVGPSDIIPGGDFRCTVRHA